MNPTISDIELDSQELTHKELLPIIRKAMLSWRVFGLVFGVIVLLMFTAGIAFQIIFLFSFFQGFLILAMISQPFYSAFRFLTKNNQLPRKLPKPTVFAFLASIIPLLTSILFLFLGIYGLQKAGFCGQSLGCIFVQIIQSSINNH